MWDIKLTATDEQTRQTNKQTKTIDADNRMAVTRGTGGAGAERQKRVNK